MPTYFLLLEYRGQAFEGWQIQAPGSRTVQGCLSQAIQALTGEQVMPRGSGRTDAGVHAEGQVASLELQSEWDVAHLLGALNARLPRDMAVLRAARVPDGFDALRDATGKRYRYRVWNRPGRSPLREARFAHVPGPLDIPAMQAAAAQLSGEHDFRSFQAAGSDVRTTVRDLHTLEVQQGPGGEIEIVAGGSGFLRHMVRNLVGTLLEVGSGRRSAGSMSELLALCDRSAAGPTAPAHGLTLERVFYLRELFGDTVVAASYGDSKGKSVSREPEQA